MAKHKDIFVPLAFKKELGRNKCALKSKMW
jgi:hypothetical protein